MSQAMFTLVSSYKINEIGQGIMFDTIQLERKSDLGSPECLPAYGDNSKAWAAASTQRDEYIKVSVSY